LVAPLKSLASNAFLFHSSAATSAELNSPAATAKPNTVEMRNASRRPWSIVFIPYYEIVLDYDGFD
jgi:hypothetical protein